MNTENEEAKVIDFLYDVITATEPLLIGKKTAHKILSLIAKLQLLKQDNAILKKQLKELNENIESMKQTNQALIKKINFLKEEFEYIANSKLSSETDGILEQNQLFKRIARDAIK